MYVYNICNIYNIMCKYNSQFYIYNTMLIKSNLITLYT